MLKLERLQRDFIWEFSAFHSPHRRVVRFISWVGLQGHPEFCRDGQRSIVTSKVRVDLTADPDAVVECADAGLALMDEGYVTVSRIVQEALAEWLNAKAFPFE